MLITKRDGRKVKFDETKIINAIRKAFEQTENEKWDEYAVAKATNIASFIKDKVKNSDKEYDVEQIQDLVENGLMSCKKKNVAREYIKYRERRRLARPNTTDNDLQDLFGGKNEYWNTENSNKDATNITVQRDYVAGITSTDLTRRLLLPDDIVKAHDEGIIQFHKKIVA